MANIFDNTDAIDPEVPSSTPRGYDEIMEIFRNNVVELRFERRTPLPRPRRTGHLNRTRRMLATANWGFLKMAVRRGTFRWKQPRRINSRDPSWYRRRRLIIVWDLMKQDFRIVSLDNWRILAYYSLTSSVNQAKFAVFYRKKLSRLNNLQRKAYSDR